MGLLRQNLKLVNHICRHSPLPRAFGDPNIFLYQNLSLLSDNIIYIYNRQLIETKAMRSSSWQQTGRATIVLFQLALCSFKAAIIRFP